MTVKTVRSLGNYYVGEEIPASEQSRVDNIKWAIIIPMRSQEQGPRAYRVDKHLGTFVGE